MNIAVVGTGYVGLVTGCCLAMRGHRVVCVDRVPSIVAKLERGEVPFYEPGLDEMLSDAIRRGTFTATTELPAAVRESKVIFVTVGTPSGPNGIDRSGIRQVAREIGIALRNTTDRKIVVVKSTVTPGTTEEIVESEIHQALKGYRSEFRIAMNPEFLREGAAVADFMDPDRIVIGCRDAEAETILRDLYSTFSGEIVVTNIKTAEMIKYASNAFFSLLVSFSNELANICEVTPSVDVQTVLRGLILDQRIRLRIGSEKMLPGLVSYLSAGCGFGGSCFPKDLAAIVEYSKDKGYVAKILQSILDVNRDRPLRLVRILQSALGDLRDRNVAVLGLAFKPGTDDMRESPTIGLINALIKMGTCVHAYDPVAIPKARDLWNNGSGIRWASSAEAALRNADAAVVMTAWDEFRSLTAETYRDLMKYPVIVDGRRIYDPEQFKTVHYYPIGYSMPKVTP